ncbi:MAG: hypothetical protein NT013_19140 [Planctomycetia bacterium]|nr:hypothetical protein [Planctomycetia bacterium]
MSLSTDLEILNRVLRDVSGCFLQYVGDCWPWTSISTDGDQLKSIVDQCVARQRESIRLMTEYLAPRQARVESGAFTADFTDLHYVSLKFLIKQLISTQSRVVESVDRTKTMLPTGDSVLDILNLVSRNEHENLAAISSSGS